MLLFAEPERIAASLVTVGLALEVLKLFGLAAVAEAEKPGLADSFVAVEQFVDFGVSGSNYSKG